MDEVVMDFSFGTFLLTQLALMKVAPNDERDKFSYSNIKNFQYHKISIGTMQNLGLQSVMTMYINII
jgi:hypothetical protein